MRANYNQFNRGDLTASQLRDKREMIVKILPSTLEKIFTGDGNMIIKSNLPKDTRIMRIDWDHLTDTFNITVESSSFGICPEGHSKQIIWDAIKIESEKDYVSRKVKKLKE